MRSTLTGLLKRCLEKSGHYRRKLARTRFPGVAVLCYHGVLDDHADRESVPFAPLHVSRSELENHCRLLREHCHPISIHAWQAARNGDAPLPERPVLVTFDDGYRNVFHRARPVLERFDVPALVFVTSGAVRAREPFCHDRAALHYGEEAVEDAKSYPFPQWSRWCSGAAVDSAVADLEPLTPDEVSELARHRLFTVGGHTASHLILSRADEATQRGEILGNQRELEEWAGEPVVYFAYPNGRPGIDYDGETVRLLREAEFRMAFTTRSGFAAAGDGVLELPRFFMLAGISHAELAHRLAYSWWRSAAS